MFVAVSAENNDKGNHILCRARGWGGRGRVCLSLSTVFFLGTMHSAIILLKLHNELQSEQSVNPDAATPHQE